MYQVRRWLVISMAVVAVAGLSTSAQAGKVEIKGTHLCCKMCITIANGTLGKVAGVADFKAEKGGAMTFTTKDAKSTEAALKALADAGYYGTATDDGKAVEWTVATPKAEKADEVTVKSVHVCCGMCRTAINGLFKDAKVTYEGKGSVLDVKIAGKGLDKAEVLKVFRKAGFNGKID
jgi:hypothetical protein